MKAISAAFKILTLFLLASSVTNASTDETIKALPDSSTWKSQQSIPDQELFQRAQAAFEYLNIPAESEDDHYLDHVASPFSFNALTARLKIFDPLLSFIQYLQFNDQEARVFQDRFSKTVPDLSYQFRPVNSNMSLKERILRAQKNAALSQLKGLRIALDPGHMGGDFWDSQTGKFVSDGHRKVSEGLINLQVCLLLKKNLEVLGATVLITHQGLTAVSALDFKSFNLDPFAQEEIRFHSNESWFVSLLSSAASFYDIPKKIDSSAVIHDFFHEHRRNEYFIKRADLDARVQMMARFKPDITLYIHHDTAFNGGISDLSPSKTRAFIPGSFQANEVADRASRRFLMNHWVDEEAWDLSLQMIRETLHQIHLQMGIPLATSDGNQSVKVEDGIFSRNLLVPRKLQDSVSAYYELFFYDRRQEFNALSETKYSVLIDGKSYPYSERLKQSVQSLQDGLVHFVQSAK